MGALFSKCLRRKGVPPHPSRENSVPPDPPETGVPPDPPETGIPPDPQRPIREIEETSDPEVRDVVVSIYEDDLKEYDAACKEDPELRTYDIELRKLTVRAIESLGKGSENEPLPFDSLIEVSDSLIQMNQTVVPFILESEENVWDNEEFSSLVYLFLKGSNKILEFCNALESGVARAKISRMIIQRACKLFEKEGRRSHEGDDVRAKYARTLKELERFEQAGEPFGEDFFQLYRLVYDEQVLLLERLKAQKQKLDTNLKDIKKWRRVSNVVFATAFVSVLILSVVAAAIVMPPAVPAVAGVMLGSAGSIGTWCSELWKKYEEEVKAKRDMIISMIIGTMKTKTGLENIHAVVRCMKAKIQPLLQAATFGLTEDEEEELRHWMEEIKEGMDQFVGSVQLVGEQALRFHKLVIEARERVIERVAEHPAD